MVRHASQISQNALGRLHKIAAHPPMSGRAQRESGESRAGRGANILKDIAQHGSLSPAERFTNALNIGAGNAADWVTGLGTEAIDRAGRGMAGIETAYKEEAAKAKASSERAAEANKRTGQKAEATRSKRPQLVADLNAVAAKAADKLPNFSLTDGLRNADAQTATWLDSLGRNLTGGVPEASKAGKDEDSQHASAAVNSPLGQGVLEGKIKQKVEGDKTISDDPELAKQHTLHLEEASSEAKPEAKAEATKAAPTAPAKTDAKPEAAKSKLPFGMTGGQAAALAALLGAGGLGAAALFNRKKKKRAEAEQA